MRWFSQIALLALSGVLIAAAGCTRNAEEKQAPEPVASKPADGKSVAPGTTPSTGQKTDPAESQQPVDPANRQSGAPQLPGPHPTTPAAKKLLDQVVVAYRAADSYSDEGRILLSYKHQGKPSERIYAEFGTVYQKPNKLRLQHYAGVMVCDGQQLVAQIDGTATGITGLNDQVLVLEAPKQLTMESIFSDRVWYTLISRQIAGINPQIAFLLGEDPAGDVLSGAAPPRFGQPVTIEERTCQRVVIPHAAGDLVFCIDEQTFELRRVELPVGDIKRHLDPQNETTEFAVTAEFVKARLGGELPAETFAIEIPEGVTLMRQFVDVVRPAAPSPLLGKRLEGLSFKALDGTEITADSLAGKITVFDFWATWCDPCLRSLPNLERVYQKYKDNPKVQVFAVAIDDDEKVEDLQGVFKELKVNIPIARPTDGGAWLQSAQVVNIPQLFVVDAEGKLQEIEVGFNENLATDLPKKIDEIRAGKNLYFASQQSFEKQEAEYQKILHESSVDGPLKDVSADGFAKIPTASEPGRLKLDKLWSSEELTSPGNVHALRDPRGKVTALLVDEGWKSVAEVGLDGKLGAVHPLDLGEQEFVFNLRSTTDKAGKRYYLVSAPGQQRVHLYDDAWKLLWHHPEGQHEGIGAAEFADLDSDQVPEIVIGYHGVVGLHGVSLDGKRIWSNKSLEYVTSLVVTNPGAKHPGGIVCTNAEGLLVALDKQGQTVREIAVGPRTQPYLFRDLKAFDLNNDGTLEYCGLSISAAGRDVAVGVSNDGRELWNYPLPPGRHRQPVEAVTAGPLPGQDRHCWVLAGANGSLHFLAADGSPIDEFRTGAAVSGMALFADAGRSVLVVATASDDAGAKLEAWQITAPAVAEKKDAEAK